MKRLKVLTASAAIFFASILPTSASFAQSLEKKLDCVDTGGGYRTTALKVSVVNNQFVFLEIANWSPFARTEGLVIEGVSAMKAEIAFPIANCHFRPTQNPSITLLHCSTAISEVSAKLTRLDGTEVTVSLPNNVYLHTRQVNTMGSSESQDQETLEAGLDLQRADDKAGVGFLTRNCK